MSEQTPEQTTVDDQTPEAPEAADNQTVEADQVEADADANQNDGEEN